MQFSKILEHQNRKTTGVDKMTREELTKIMDDPEQFVQYNGIAILERIRELDRVKAVADASELSRTVSRKQYTWTGGNSLKCAGHERKYQSGVTVSTKAHVYKAKIVTAALASVEIGEKEVRAPTTPVHPACKKLVIPPSAPLHTAKLMVDPAIFKTLKLSDDSQSKARSRKVIDYLVTESETKAIAYMSGLVEYPKCCTRKFQKMSMLPMRDSVQVVSHITVQVPKAPPDDKVIQAIRAVYVSTPPRLKYNASVHYDGYPLFGRARYNHDRMRDFYYVDSKIYVTDVTDTAFVNALYNKINANTQSTFLIVVNATTASANWSEWLDITDTANPKVKKSGIIRFSRHALPASSYHYISFYMPDIKDKKKTDIVKLNTDADNIYKLNERWDDVKSYQRYITYPVVDKDKDCYQASVLARKGLVIEMSKAGKSGRAVLAETFNRMVHMTVYPYTGRVYDEKDVDFNPEKVGDSEDWMAASDYISEQVSLDFEAGIAAMEKMQAEAKKKLAIQKGHGPVQKVALSGKSLTSVSNTPTRRENEGNDEREEQEEEEEEELFDISALDEEV